MPYPLSDDRDRLIDMMPPHERMLFELLENQMQQTQIVTNALIATRWWAVSSTGALGIVLAVYTVALFLRS